MNNYLKIIALAAVGGIGAQAHATFAFDNFSAGQTFNNGSGATISSSGSAAGQNWIQGYQFTSLASGSLDRITIALSHVTGTNTSGVDLYNDASGALGTFITGWSVSNLPAFGAAYVPSVLINSFPSITLTSGFKYWVVARPGASDTWNVWNANTSGSILNRTFSNDNGATFGYSSGATAGAFSVEVVAVPEPATFAAFGFGALILLRRFRKR